MNTKKSKHHFTLSPTLFRPYSSEVCLLPIFKNEKAKTKKKGMTMEDGYELTVFRLRSVKHNT